MHHQEAFSDLSLIIPLPCGRISLGSLVGKKLKMDYLLNNIPRAKENKQHGYLIC